MVTFLHYVNVIWLFYHIFLVIGMDWVFSDKSGEAAPLAHSAVDDVYDAGYVIKSQAIRDSTV